MDIAFDIDGTLANAAHRIHFINDPDKVKDWENFLSDEQVAQDTPIEQTWDVMDALLSSGHRVLFITGRKESQRTLTHEWLTNTRCPVRGSAAMQLLLSRKVPLFMRAEGDRRASHVVKRELLHQARAEGFDPTLVFEDRKDDTAMWRDEGLMCCQVAEGNY